MTRPGADEFDPYFSAYIGLVPEGEITALLDSQFGETMQLAERFVGAHEEYRYEDMKWSVRELIGHCIDVERTFQFRALFLGRNQPVDLPSFDQDVANDHAPHDERSLADLLEEWRCVRASTLHLARSLDGPALGRRGVASGSMLSTRAALWIIAGHELHHRNVLAERYTGVLTGGA